MNRYLRRAMPIVALSLATLLGGCVVVPWGGYGPGWHGGWHGGGWHDGWRR